MSPNANAFRPRLHDTGGGRQFLACAPTGAQRQAGGRRRDPVAGWHAGDNLRAGCRGRPLAGGRGSGEVANSPGARDASAWGGMDLRLGSEFATRRAGWRTRPRAVRPPRAPAPPAEMAPHAAPPVRTYECWFGFNLRRRGRRAKPHHFLACWQAGRLEGFRFAPRRPRGVY
jgi:hypothetical protein